MTEDSAANLQHWLDRFLAGDPKAAENLVAFAYERMRILARFVLRKSFAQLSQRHDGTSVLNAALIRMLKALDAVRPTTLREFLGFLALQIRRELGDRVRQERGSLRSKIGEFEEGFDPPDAHTDPADLEAWSKLHEAIATLPKEEREVMDLCFYGDLSQREAATQLQRSQSAVSRLWASALQKLPDVRLP